MAKVKVYYFQAYDITTDSKVRSKRPATLKAIEELGPMYYPIRATEELIDDSELDHDGFRRKP